MPYSKKSWKLQLKVATKFSVALLQMHKCSFPYPPQDDLACLKAIKNNYTMNKGTCEAVAHHQWIAGLAMSHWDQA